MEKNEYFKKAINWARKQGISDIKAKYEGFEQPSVFTTVDSEKPFIPDVTGKKFGSKFYIEIATKTENIQREGSKWKLLSTLAKMKGGKLFLLAPKGHKTFAERIIKRYNLENTQLVYMPNI